MTDQVIPFGGTVEYSTDGSAFTSVPEAKGFPVPNTTTEFPEVTSLDSPNGFREFIAGLKDAGEVSFVAGYTPAGFEALEALQGDQLLYWRVTFPLAPSQASAGDVFAFRAYCTPAVDAGDVGAPINMNVALRISGAVTYTRGS